MAAVNCNSVQLWLSRINSVNCWKLTDVSTNIKAAIFTRSPKLPFLPRLLTTCPFILSSYLFLSPIPIAYWIAATSIWAVYKSFQRNVLPQTSALKQLISSRRKRPNVGSTLAGKNTVLSTDTALSANPDFVQRTMAFEKPSVSCNSTDVITRFYSSYISHWNPQLHFL